MTAHISVHQFNVVVSRPLVTPQVRLVVGVQDVTAAVDNLPLVQVAVENNASQDHHQALLSSRSGLADNSNTTPSLTIVEGLLKHVDPEVERRLFP